MSMKKTILLAMLAISKNECHLPPLISINC